MENPQRGPWGRQPETIDRIRNQSVGLEDGAYIESVLKAMLERLVNQAREAHISFRGSLKPGLPGILTMEQAEGDIYQLLDAAREMAQNINALDETKNRSMEFATEYMPVSRKVPIPAIIISGMTSR